MVLALSGIKVLDISQVAGVPMAARFLADFGADVIHVEHPVRGDSFRDFRTGYQERYNFVWENYNRNKRSMTVDLTHEEGQEIIHRLVRQSDVFLTNYRSKELEKFKASYEILRQLNPKLIYGWLNGYGTKGPDKDSPGFDQTAYWHRSGLSYVLTWPDSPPPPFQPAIGDNVAGVLLAYGIMTALFTRERTGLGQKVDLALFHAGIFVNSFHIAGTLASNNTFEDWSPRSWEDFPNALVNIYKTKDKKWINLTLWQPDRWWASLCKAVGHPELENDPRFTTFEDKQKNHLALHKIMEDIFIIKTIDEWKIILKAADIPFSPMQNLKAAIDDPQSKANNFIVSYEHPSYGTMDVIANPINLSETPANIRMPAPEHGQHTEEILLEIGYDWNDISNLRENRTI